MKKYLIPTAAVVIATALGTPYYLGVRAEESLTEQQKLLQESGFLTVGSHQHDRGWFSSTETTAICLKPTLLQNTQKYLSDNLRTVLQEPITVINHVTHGPSVGGFGMRAHVEAELQYHPEIRKVLDRFFGQQIPLTMTNTVYLSGDGKFNLNIPAFDYEELSGIKLNWKGFSGNTDYSQGFESYRHDHLTPSLQTKLADKDDVSLENLRFQSETENDLTKLSLDRSNTMLDKFLLQWKENIDYNVKLNELVSLVANLQIGAFINPTDTIAPSKIGVNKLRFDTQTDAADKFIDGEGRFQFESLTCGENKYGPLDINVAAEHLDAASLLVLKNKIAGVSVKKMSEEEIRASLLQTTRNEASGLFTNNPVLNIKTFKFTMPNGDVDVSGKLAFKGLTAKDLNSLGDMLKKTETDFNMSVPQKLLEQPAVNQVSSLLSVNAEDEATGRASIDDINETLRLMVDGTIKSMTREKYLTLKDDNVKTHLTLQNSELRLNGEVLQSDPESEFDESDLPNN